MTAKPYKVWNSARTAKKSLTAATLEQLIDKGRSKLGLPQDARITVVLECDGTEVDDEDYFQCQDHNTTFILLTGTQQWAPPSKVTKDELDSAMPSVGNFDTSDSFSEETTAIPVPSSDKLEKLAACIRTDISKIITFSSDELQQIAEANTQRLSRLLGQAAEETRHLQESCQRHLDDRQRALDAISLLKVLSQGQEPGNKRPRMQ